MRLSRYVLGLLFLATTVAVAQQKTDISSLLEMNEIYSADIDYTITIGDLQETLKGKIVVDTSFTYMKLRDTEFFTYQDYTIKVVNPEKKIAISNGAVSKLSEVILNPDDISNIYFQPERESYDENTYVYKCYPIESMKGYIGELYIYTDLKDHITKMLQKVPSGNAFGVEQIEITYYNRKETTNLKLHPKNFFSIKEGVLDVISKYNNYQIL